MTGFMTYSVYSLSFSNSTPTQSDFVPILTLYFLFSISFNLFCMCWFVLCNYWTTTPQKVPACLMKFCGLLQRIFCCCFDDPNKDKNKGGAVESGGDGKKKRCFGCCCSKTNEVSMHELTNHNVTISEVKTVSEKADGKEANYPKPDYQKCHFCDRCGECQKDFDKEKDKNKVKKDVESKMSALNYFVFIIAFLYLLAFQLGVWLSNYQN